MRALILCAGHGSRLGALSDTCPKPLQPLGNQTILSNLIGHLKQAGITEIVINLHHLGDLIYNNLGNGQKHGVNILYSYEPHLLGTGGAIVNALPLLGPDFFVINGDIITKFDLTTIPCPSKTEPAHIILTPNPAHNPAGDFSIHHHQATAKQPHLPSYTFTGIGRYHHSIFKNLPRTNWPLANLLHYLVANRRLTASISPEFWSDLGRPSDLMQAQKNFQIQQ